MNKLLLLDRIPKECLRSWWVIVLLLLCIFSYEWRLKETGKMKEMLGTELIELNKKLSQELKLQRELKLELNSVHDQKWKEKRLISSLGVAPIGYKIITFPIE